MDVLLFRGEILKAHPEAVRTVIKGWYRAVDYWKKNPDESDTLMARVLGCWLQDVRAFKKELDGVRLYDEATNEQCFATNGQIYVTAQKALEIWTALGKITSTVTPADLIDSDFVRR